MGADLLFFFEKVIDRRPRRATTAAVGAKETPAWEDSSSCAPPSAVATHLRAPVDLLLKKKEEVALHPR